MLMLRCSWLHDRCCPMIIVLRRCQRILFVRTTLYIIPSLLWLIIIHVEKLSCIRHKNFWYSTPVLSNVSHILLPWLKSTIIIQSPLLTSVIELRIFSLFCLVMLGQRHTTPMVTVVCPETNLHHMASLHSASSANCTYYAGIVSLMYNNTPPPLLPIPKHYLTCQSQFSICYILVCP